MTKNMAETKKWVLAKGKGLKIPGIQTMITNENVNSANIITIITNHEKRSGHKYFGTLIIQK